MAALAVSAFAAEGELGNWPQWRGPLANGVAPQGNPPVEWSQDKNLRWKVEVPGVGSSTPIIWGDRVFLLSAIETDQVVASAPAPADQPKRGFGIVFPNKIHQFVVLCLDRATGKTLWKKVATEQLPHEGHHPDNDFASASPATDGKHLYASFGSRGVYCYDMEGNLKWKRDLGKMTVKNSFGEGASPALHGDTLVAQFDHDGPSFIAALDASTGEIRWKKDRDEKSDWATPLIVERGGTTQVVTNASNRVRSYDLKNGDLLWECAGQVGNVTPAPVASEKLVFCMSGFRGSALFALPLDQRGDLTDTDKIAWKYARDTPYVPSALLYDDRLYFTKENNGILTCLEASTGKVIFGPQRMPEIAKTYASPVGAAGRVYITARDGTTLVIRHADKYEVLATNILKDPIDASPAIVGKDIFLRGEKHLYCFREE